MTPSEFMTLYHEARRDMPGKWTSYKEAALSHAHIYAQESLDMRTAVELSRDTIVGLQAELAKARQALEKIAMMAPDEQQRAVEYAHKILASLEGE